MIDWLLFGLPGQIALCVFAAWFGWGVWKAVMRPRLVYISHVELKHGKGKLLTVKRQQLLPPWLVKEETWLLAPYGKAATREGDGESVADGGYSHNSRQAGLARALHGVWEVAVARSAETDELLRDEKARAN